MTHFRIKFYNCICTKKFPLVCNVWGRIYREASLRYPTGWKLLFFADTFLSATNKCIQLQKCLCKQPLERKLKHNSERIKRASLLMISSRIPFRSHFYIFWKLLFQLFLIFISTLIPRFLLKCIYRTSINQCWFMEHKNDQFSMVEWTATVQMGEMRLLKKSKNWFAATPSMSQ